MACTQTNKLSSWKNQWLPVRMISKSDSVKSMNWNNRVLNKNSGYLREKKKKKKEEEEEEMSSRKSCVTVSACVRACVRACVFVWTKNKETWRTKI